RVSAAHSVRHGVLAEQAIGFVPDDPRHAVAVRETRAGVYPVPAVGNYVWGVATSLLIQLPLHLVGVLDANQRLLRTVERRVTPRNGFQGQVGDRVDVGVPVTHYHTIRPTAAGRFEPHLGADRVGAEEGEVDSRI